MLPPQNTAARQAWKQVLRFDASRWAAPQLSMRAAQIHLACLLESLVCNSPSVLGHDPPLWRVDAHPISSRPVLTPCLSPTRNTERVPSLPFEDLLTINHRDQECRYFGTA
jgi:hypothetical protein